MKVKFLNEVRRIAGTSTIDVDADRVDELLMQLVKRFGPKFRKLLFRGMSFKKDDINILVNGRAIEFQKGLAAPLDVQDEVTIYQHGARGFPGG